MQVKKQGGKNYRLESIRESSSRREVENQFVQRNKDRPPMGSRSIVCGWGMNGSRKSRDVSRRLVSGQTVFGSR